MERSNDRGPRSNSRSRNDGPRRSGGFRGNNDRRSGGFRGNSGPRRDGFRRNDGPREMHKATCSKCGNECQVPFKPTQGKPVYCNDCFVRPKRY